MRNRQEPTKHRYSTEGYTSFNHVVVSNYIIDVKKKKLNFQDCILSAFNMFLLPRYNLTF